jgi:hypothetical protein
LNPQVGEVDFQGIAETLARINLYNGAYFSPVSVAQHTLIACDACLQELIPWVLLHDAYKARTGDIAQAQIESLVEVLNELSGGASTAPLREAVHLLEDRHINVIREAAGVKKPTASRIVAVARAPTRLRRKRKSGIF